jgi:phospholipase C
MTETSRFPNLDKVDHIVVLMMENRSFDHMLGYLALEGRADVDGLQAGFANEYQGRTYPVHHLPSTAVAVDPDHSADAVDLQLGGGKMDGFVASYAATLASRGGVEDPGAVMGYYDGADVPVYDHLAEEFVVCDRWFSSVPGATWPNRLYALCGRAARSRDDLPLNMPPIYNQPSFVRHLNAHDVSWRWYSFDPGTLRLADATFKLGHHDRYAHFTKTGLNWKTKYEVRIGLKAASFLEDAAQGTLPSVSWIDPAFTNGNMLGFRPNDDHAPGDIRDGQDLVLAVYHALATGPLWQKTLLIIFYDEHGGFFDHVPPPEAPDDDPEMFGRYGVRIPALIVSPWVAPRFVSKTLYDHTSVMKTILLRFCAEALERNGRRHERLITRLRFNHPHYVGTRAAQANDLGELLTGTEPRPAPDMSALVAAAEQRAAEEAERPPAESHPPTDLQIRIASATHHLRHHGHPEGHP